MAARAILIAASTASVPLLAGTIGPHARGRARQQLLRQDPAEQSHAELRKVAGARRHHILHGLDRLGVVAPNREHPIATEQVEVAVALRVDQMCPLAAHPHPVEPSVRRMRPIWGLRWRSLSARSSPVRDARISRTGGMGAGGMDQEYGSPRPGPRGAEAEHTPRDALPPPARAISIGAHAAA